jgi:hypothetical protein
MSIYFHFDQIKRQARLLTLNLFDKYKIAFIIQLPDNKTVFTSELLNINQENIAIGTIKQGRVLFVSRNKDFGCYAVFYTNNTYTQSTLPSIFQLDKNNISFFDKDNVIEAINTLRSLSDTVDVSDLIFDLYHEIEIKRLSALENNN